MDYEGLNALWKKRHRLQEEWRGRLIHGTVALQEAVESLLSPPHKSWREDGSSVTTHHYVEVVDFYGRDKVEHRLPIGDTIRPDGVLIFGIGFTFEHDFNTYPKSQIYIPVAVKCTEAGTQYSLFDTELSEPDGQWQPSEQEFANALVKTMETHLSHNPLHGFAKDKHIGFV